jgi:acetyl-CoA carboxylase biotin carboxyl carrier protein
MGPDPGLGRNSLSVDVTAEMMGSVWRVEKAVGDSVEEEDVLLIIESMKMEIPVEAPCAGRVAEIRVAEGQSVEEGDVLAVIE